MSAALLLETSPDARASIEDALERADEVFSEPTNEDRTRLVWGRLAVSGLLVTCDHSWRTTWSRGHTTHHCGSPSGHPWRHTCGKRDCHSWRKAVAG